MPKRGRSRSASTRRWSRRNRTPSAMRSGSVPPTPVATVQRGRTMNRAGSVVRSLSAPARSLSRFAARANPYVNAAMSAYDIGSSLYGVGKSLFGKQTKRGTGQISTSKSAGFFKATKDNTSKMDKHSISGIVQKSEFGSVRTDAVNDVVYVAQSTAPPQFMLQCMVAALIKKLFALNGIQIKSFESVLLQGQQYPMQIKLDYKLLDGGVVTSQTFAISTTDTLNNIRGAIYLFLLGRVGDLAIDQYLRITLLDDYTGWVGAARVLRASIDLSTASFRFDCKSILKIQNRTINSTGNDQDNDVDNVPLYGKYFDYNTNGTIFRDYNQPSIASPSQVTTTPFYGVLSTAAPDTTLTSMYKEVPLQSQFVGCKKSGKSHLDPGEIKTSVVTDSFNISFVKLVKTLTVKGTALVANENTQVWLGKSRLFSWERMIQPAANSAINQYSIAYEHQLNVGCTMYVKRDFQTAPGIAQAIG